MPKPPTPNRIENLTKDDLERDVFHHINKRSADPIPMVSKEEPEASLERILAQGDLDRGAYLFAYGSLIWNPCFDFAGEPRIGTVYGYSRRFCIWGKLGRGTPEKPGLLPALDRGGSCRGVLYHIAPHAVRSELRTVWRREMNDVTYLARWVTVHCGRRPFKAITFVANRACEDYAPPMPLRAMAEVIASAEGVLGPCAEYLYAMRRHLAALGIPDPSIESLCRQVAPLRPDLRDDGHSWRHSASALMAPDGAMTSTSLGHSGHRKDKPRW